MPRPRAARCTSIFLMSARCGWLGGVSSPSCTVPTILPSSLAASNTVSPAATEPATLRKKPSAESCENGDMKLTLAPPSTQSTSTSASCSSAGIRDRRGESDDLGLRAHAARSSFDATVASALSR